METISSLKSQEAEALGTIKMEEVPEFKTFNGVPHLLEGGVFGHRFKVILIF